MRSGTILSLSIGALSLFGTLSCGSGDSNIVVNVSNLPARAAHLSASALIDTRPSTNSIDLLPPMPLDRFGFSLPSSMSGRLTVIAQALDTDGCTQGLGQGQADLPTSRADIALALAPQNPRKCGVLDPCAADTYCAISLQPQPSDILGMWAIAPNDIWAVGKSGMILHWQGKTWAPSTNPASGTLNGVWASGPKDVWAVGQAGLILHYDGTQWTSSTNGAIQDLNAVFGVSPTDIWTVGGPNITTSPGEFWHWNGTLWKSVNSGINGGLLGVWASSPSDLYAVGYGGLLMHFNGSSFGLPSSLTANDLHYVWGSSPTQVFIVGLMGTILHYDGSSWQKESAAGVASLLLSVAGDSNTIYIAGNNGTFLKSNTPFTTFTALPSGTTTADVRAMALGGDGIGWVGGFGGYLAHFDIRP